MVIVSGTQQKIKKLGYVAEYCPICRSIEPFKISKVGMEDHIFFIPLGMKNVTGHLGMCMSCSDSREVDAMIYSDIAKKQGSDIEALIKKTYPKIREVYAERLELEARLITGNLTPEEREFLIMEVFQIYGKRTDEHFHAAFQAKGPGGWAFLITIAVSVTLLIMNMKYDYALEERDSYLAGVGIFFLLGLFTSVVLMFLEPGRSFKTKIIPQLAAALVPLKPGRDELTVCLTKMERAGFKIGKKTKVETLWNAIILSNSLYGSNPKSGRKKY